VAYSISVERAPRTKSVVMAEERMLPG